MLYHWLLHIWQDYGLLTFFNQPLVIMQHPKHWLTQRTARISQHKQLLPYNSTLQPYNSLCTTCFSVNSVLALKRAGLMRCRFLWITSNFILFYIRLDMAKVSWSTNFVSFCYLKFEWIIVMRFVLHQYKPRHVECGGAGAQWGESHFIAK